MVEAVVEPHAAPAPVAPAAPAPIIPAVAAPAPEWRKGLTPEQQADKGLADFKGVDGLAKAFLDTKSAYGKKMEGLVKVPGEGAAPEEVSAFDAAVRKAQGVPPSPEGYTFTVAEDLRSLVPEPALNAFKPLFHKLGIAPPAAQAIVQAYAEWGQAQLADLHKSYDQKLLEMKNEMGGPTWDYRAANAQFALKDVIGNGDGGLGPAWLEEFQGLMENTKAGSHPAMVKLFMWLGQQFREDGHVHAEFTGAGKSPEDLQRRKLEIEKDKDWHSERDPIRHKALVEEWNSVFKQLNPEPIR